LSHGTVHKPFLQMATGPDFDGNEHAREMAHSLIDEHPGLICIMHLARNVQFERGGATVILDSQTLSS